MGKKQDLYDSNFEILADVSISGSYDDLFDQPTLGTAAAQNSSAFATAAQGALADTAVQPGDLATVATTGDFNDLINTPPGNSTAGFDRVIFVDGPGGDDGTGDGSLNGPYATIAHALAQVDNDLATIDESVLISVAPGAYIESSLALKPFVTIRGSGRELTRVHVAPSNSVTLDTAGSDFEISGEIVLGLEDMDFVASGRLDIDASVIANSGGNIRLVVKGVHFEGPCELAGRPNGADRLITYDTVFAGGVTLTTIPAVFNTSKLASLSLVCTNYSGGGESVTYLNYTTLDAGLVVSCPDQSRSQVVVARHSYIPGGSIDANGTSSTSLHADAVSLPSDPTDDISFQNGATLLLLTKTLQIDGLETRLDDLQDQLDTFVAPLPVNTPNNLASFADSTGELTAINTLAITPEGGLNFFDNQFRDEQPSPSYRNIHNLGLNVSANEDIVNEFTNMWRQNVSFDPTNTGFSYGDNSGPNGGLGLFSSYFGHQGDGHLGRMLHTDHFIEIGAGDHTSSVGFISGINTNVVFRHDTTGEDVRVLFSGLDAATDVTLTGVVAYQSNIQIGAGSDITNYCNIFQGSINNNGDHIGNVNALDMSLNGSGAWDFINIGNLHADISGSTNGINLLNLSINDGAQSSGGINGISVNMGNYDTTLQRRATFNGNGGAIVNNQEVSTLPNMFFDQGNILNTLFHVKPGEPITGTTFISNNFSTGFLIEDDIDGGLLGLGVASVGFVGQLAVSAGKTAALINFGVGGASIADMPGLGGTVEKANIYNALGIVNAGGPNDVVVEEVRGFVLTDGSLGDALWGIDIQDARAENHFAKSVVIGANNTVTNSDIALELSDKKALKLTALTIAERDALTAVAGMIVRVVDTGVNELQVYNGTTWARNVEIVAVPATSADPGLPGQIAIESGWLYTCVATDTWERVPTVTF